MNIINWSQSIMKRLRWYDIKLVQISTVFAILALITLWPAFLTAVQKVEWYWYLILAVIFGIPIAKRMFWDK